MTQARGTASPPRVIVKSPAVGYGFDLLFQEFVFEHELIRWLFVSATLPQGVTVAAINMAAYLTTRWSVRHTVPTFDFVALLTPYGEQLWRRAMAGGEETDTERRAREEEQAQRRAENVERNKTFIPALNMSAARAFEQLDDGAYLAAPGRVPVRIELLGSEPPYPPDLSWFKGAKDGMFVWLGYGRDGRLLELNEVSDHVTFQKDVLWRLQRGDRLSEAIKDFEAQSVRLHLRVLAAFGEALASAPGSYPRADRLDRTAMTLGRGTQRRLTADEPAPMPTFGKLRSQFDPTDVAHAALATTSGVMNTVELIRDLDADDPGDPELDALANETSRILADRFRALSPGQSFPIVGTGNQGEHLVATMMRLRGYEVIALQNPSGHGIDLIAFKPGLGSQGTLVYLEIKTSLGDSAPGLSEAQKDPRGFVRSRLQRAADGEGAYTHLPASAKQLAALLIQEIDAGRPIGGIKVTVTQLGKSLRLKIKVKRWSLPKAQVVRNRRGRR